MKQKVVIKMTLKGQKCRQKALKAAVSISGVESAALGENDKIEVTGDIDAVILTTQLRKNVGHAEIVSVSAVGEKKEEKKEEEKNDPFKLMPYVYTPSIPLHYEYRVPYNSPDPSCSIM